MMAEDTVIHLIHRAEQCAVVLLQNRTLEHGLTPTQIAILSALATRAGLSQTQLCDATGVDRSTMGDVVKRLVKKGLVRRTRTRRDARTNAIELTNHGQQAIAAVTPVAATVGEELLAVLPERGRRKFIQSLLTVIAALESERMIEAAAPDAPPKRDRRPGRRKIAPSRQGTPAASVQNS
jgi:DNA-binding MarR family transcriptional regulator